jgi:hypothetical protein
MYVEQKELGHTGSNVIIPPKDEQDNNNNNNKKDKKDKKEKEKKEPCKKQTKTYLKT